MAAELNARRDVVIIGTGPAGLAGAGYLARYRRDIPVLHDGKSRALRIPLAYITPGFRDGIRGPELIARMTRHAVQYGAAVEEVEVVMIDAVADGFRLRLKDGSTRTSRAIILATGIELNQVDLPHAVHEEAIRAGVLRYCPVCAGYEHTDRRFGVIGCDSSGAAEALFLRQYSDDVTLMPLSHPELSPAQVQELAASGVSVERGALLALEPGANRIGVRLEGLAPLEFDVIYPALGCRPRSVLAEQLGIGLTGAGCVSAACVADSGSPASSPPETSWKGLIRSASPWAMALWRRQRLKTGCASRTTTRCRLSLEPEDRRSRPIQSDATSAVRVIGDLLNSEEQRLHGQVTVS